MPPHRECQGSAQDFELGQSKACVAFCYMRVVPLSGAGGYQGLSAYALSTDFETLVKPFWESFAHLLRNFRVRERLLQSHGGLYSDDICAYYQRLTEARQAQLGKSARCSELSLGRALLLPS